MVCLDMNTSYCGQIPFLHSQLIIIFACFFLSIHHGNSNFWCISDNHQSAVSVCIAGVSPTLRSSLCRRNGSDRYRLDWRCFTNGHANIDCTQSILSLSDTFLLSVKCSVRFMEENTGYVRGRLRGLKIFLVATVSVLIISHSHDIQLVFSTLTS